jgi:iduronate 2-sulfatase
MFNNLTTLSALSAAGLAGVAVAAAQPNVLFIPVDDLKPTLGCYGDPMAKTPNIDRIAARGMVFRNSQCQQAVCGPTRASLLTGLRPDTTRVWDLKTKMRDIIPDVVTLPQHFKNNGYTTVGMGKIFDGRCCDGWGSQDKISWSTPFQSVPGRLYANKAYSSKMPSAKSNNQVQRPPFECADVPDNVYQDGNLGDVGAKHLARLLEEGKPFFLAVGFGKPHLPFCAPKKYWDLYDRNMIKAHPFQGKAKDSPDFAYQDCWELRGGYTGIPKGPIPEDMQIELIHGYYACVSYMDAQVGKLLDVLEEAGQLDNTVIVLWGDHGWHLGDHGMFCKHTNFEQAARAPLIIAGPHTKGKGQKSLSPVEFVDIFPTLCDLAGLAKPAQLEGASLMPILNDPTASVKKVAISQYPRNADGKPLMGYSYRSKRYRYTVWVQAHSVRGGTKR